MNSDIVYDIDSQNEWISSCYNKKTYYHWIIMLVNNVTDPYHDWPKTQREMQLYLGNKYGDAEAQQSVHHYEIAQDSGDTTIKIWVENDADTDAYTSTAITPITNYEYEQNEQDRKRQIQLLDPNYVNMFINEFANRMKESII